MRGQWTETVAGVLVLGIAAAFLTYLFLVGDFSVGKKGYALTARFGQVGSLAQGADVRVAGVKVGTVSKITLDPATYFATTRLEIDPDIKLPADSTAKITSDGLLGGAHMVIEPGGAAEYLKPGAEIPNTQGAVDLLGLIGEVVRPKAAPADPEPVAQ